MKKKVKKVSKYIMNILAMLNALLIGLSPIWGWNLDKLTDSIWESKYPVQRHRCESSKLISHHGWRTVRKGEEMQE